MTMRGCFFAFGVIFLLMTTHSSQVHCRILEAKVITTTTTIAATECKQSGGEMLEFMISSTRNTSDVNSSDNRRLKMRSLGYKLASGPSKRGPGH
ncbi:hypothetical protein SSX86_007733 [Deinandra increscens subsp. villosa]|uniref:Uncharacterized protein n=1 Tax=Deinandra increscens subsp. villosa TaxID=3103831 RepID=A0AAP0H5A2_9ASTR